MDIRNLLHFAVTINDDEELIWTYQCQKITPFLGGIFYAEWKFVPKSFIESYVYYIKYARLRNLYQYDHPPIWGWLCKRRKYFDLELGESLLSESQIDSGMLLLALAVPKKMLLFSDYDQWNDLMDKIIGQEPIADNDKQIFLTKCKKSYCQVTFPEIRPQWIKGIWKIYRNPNGLCYQPMSL